MTDPIPYREYQWPAPKVEAAFLWPIVAWTVLGFGAIAYAAWWASR